MAAIGDFDLQPLVGLSQCRALPIDFFLRIGVCLFGERQTLLLRGQTHLALFDALEQMLAIGEEYHAQWLTFGPRSKAGHPHHPLYLRRDSVPEPFDVRAYCAAQRERLK